MIKSNVFLSEDSITLFKDLNIYEIPDHNKCFLRDVHDSGMSSDMICHFNRISRILKSLTIKAGLSFHVAINETLIENFGKDICSNEKTSSFSHVDNLLLSLKNVTDSENDIQFMVNQMVTLGESLILKVEEKDKNEIFSKVGLSFIFEQLRKRLIFRSISL